MIQVATIQGSFGAVSTRSTLHPGLDICPNCAALFSEPLHNTCRDCYLRVCYACYHLTTLSVDHPLYNKRCCGEDE
jgi:hypothetical protein